MLTQHKYLHHGQISSAIRIILLNETGFACGFYTDYYGVFFAVGIAKTWTDWSVGNVSRYFSHLIWSANRNKPVCENATLQLLPEGNLVLRDADGTLASSVNLTSWSPRRLLLLLCFFYEYPHLLLHQASSNMSQFSTPVILVLGCWVFNGCRVA